MYFIKQNQKNCIHQKKKLIFFYKIRHMFSLLNNRTINDNNITRLIIINEHMFIMFGKKKTLEKNIKTLFLREITEKTIVKVFHFT